MPEDGRRLPVGYYVDNFEAVLATVAERYDDLLSADEQAFLHGYRQLALPARRLYVRLLSRKGPCFRQDRLVYAEIPDLDAAVGALLEARFADRADDVPPRRLARLLLRDELADLAGELRPGDRTPSARRAELLELLEAIAPAELDAGVRARVDVICLRRLEQVEVLRLLYFGNLRQDWTEHLLRDLGVMRYESYELRRDRRLFADRQAIDDTLRGRRLRHQVRALLAAGDATAALAEVDGAAGGDWHPQARRWRDAALAEVGRHLERTGELERALALYAAADAPPARERRARILDRLGRVDDALRLCAEIAAGPRDEGETLFAPRFAHRLRRRRGDAIPALRRTRRPLRHLRCPLEGHATVERAVLAHLEADGRAAFFAENWLWRSLFGLAFWDIVFAPVQGAFQHPFQTAPLDLSTSAFRRSREEAIEARLAELADDDDPAARLLSVYDAKLGIANRLVAWQDTRPLLELALSRLHGRHLTAVFDRLSREPGRYGRGLPDLFLLRDRPPGFALWELKGPGDALRPEQGAWIDYLNTHGLPTAVIKVEDGE